MSERSVGNPAGTGPAAAKPATPALKRAADFAASIPNRGLKWISACAIMAVMFLVVTDVCARTFFNSPLKGSYELVQSGMLVIAWFAVSFTQFRNRFVRIDIISNKWPKWLMVHLDRFDYVAAAALWFVVAWQSAKHGMELYRLHQTTMALHYSVMPFYWLVCFGAGLLGVVLLANCVQSFYKKPEVKK